MTDLPEPLRTHLGWLLAKVMKDERYPEARGIWERYTDCQDSSPLPRASLGEVECSVCGNEIEANADDVVCSSCYDASRGELPDPVVLTLSRSDCHALLGYLYRDKKAWVTALRIRLFDALECAGARQALGVDGGSVALPEAGQPGKPETRSEGVREALASSPTPPADRDLAPLRALVEDWKLKARDDAKEGAAQAMTSDREYYGRVNAAFVYRDCADELEHALAALTQSASDPPESH